MAVAAGNACMHDEGDAAHVEGPAYVDGMVPSHGNTTRLHVAERNGDGLVAKTFYLAPVLGEIKHE